MSTLPPGTRLGPYEIVSPIGSGGMGEVFKARDVRLDRSVAIKILPAEFAQNAQLKLRLEREAKTISQLNHPNICTLYDVGHENGTDYLVMELCEGESLADRISRGALPIAQVLHYGIQIADALDKAHRRGIIHRDLKPANIMITPSAAKLLDFGLAKHAPIVQPVSGAAFGGATEHKPLTAEGTIIGTFQYMAPEQLEGAEADARTDIFALGTVMYEMAAGKRAFDGKTKTSLIAAIIDRDPPPISQFQPLTPPAFERIVKTCLAKDPEDRWQTAHDVLLQLRWIEEAGSQAGVAAPVLSRRKHREWLSWSLAALLLVTAAVLGALWYRTTLKKPQRVETFVTLPDKLRLFGPPMLSPDGRLLTFTLGSPEGRLQLYLRPMNGDSLRPLSGAENGTFPFWSPDSRFIAFFADGKLKKIDVAGGPPQTLCEAPAGRGGSWSRNGTIVFAPSERNVLYRVSAAGGSARPLTKLGDKEISHRYPWFLPDGRHFLFLAQSPSLQFARGRILLGDLESNKVQPLIDANSGAMYSEPGYVLFIRDRSLVAQPFDARRLRVTEEAFPIADSVQWNQRMALHFFSVAPNGLLAFRRGASILESRLLWFDRNGKELSVVSTPGDYNRPRLSHDGRRLAFEVIDAAGSTADIWVHDLLRKTATRLTFDKSIDTSPVWSPDDRNLLMGVEDSEKGTRTLVTKISSGAGSQQPIHVAAGTVGLLPTDWSRDGRFIVFHQSTSGVMFSQDLWIYSVLEKKASPYLVTPFGEWQAQFSPDGRWIAYTSNESGRAEIYVQSFPATGAKWQISTQGGFVPRWRGDGKELFYIAADNRMMSVPILATPDTLEPGSPVALFTARPRAGGLSYDVAADGQRFLINTLTEDETQEPITVIQNWTAEMKDQ